MVQVALPVGFVVAFAVVFLAVKGWDKRPGFTELPGQAELLGYIWHDIFRVSRFSWLKPWTYRHRVPRIDWVTGARLDNEGRGFWYTWDNGKQRMSLAGQSFDNGVAKVALPKGKAVKDSALVHELFHLCLMRRSSGDGDMAHTDRGWYEMSGEVAQATAALGKSALGSHVG